MDSTSPLPLARQFARFAIVGLISNALLYGFYLLATHLGVQHSLAMTGVFALGILQTFGFNRNWSFNHKGSARAAMFRYVIAYAVAYVINLSAMLLLVDKEGLPDSFVEAAMIVVVALFLFVVQRLWVFPNKPTQLGYK